jgi:hypothetical protein
MVIRYLTSLLLIIGAALWLSHLPEPAPAPLLTSKLPLYFIENQGQLDAQVAYYVHGRRAAAYLTSTSVIYSLSAGSRRASVHFDLINANPSPRLSPNRPTPALVSYFRGPRPQWKTALPTYSSVTYRDVWPGIDLEFAGPEGQLKYTFHLLPGADPGQIRFAYRGAASVRLTAAGTLHVDTPAGGFTDDQPVAWQQTGAGRRSVPVAFRLHHDEISFQLGAYDPTQPLTIDPVVLLYAGFLGGAATDSARAIAVDQAGNTYLTGHTESLPPSFPLASGPDLTHNGAIDAFVIKVNSTGTALLYAGYLGGAGDDYGNGIAVDPAGNAYLIGQTSSNEASFPVAIGPDLTYNGSTDAFVAKINPTGTQLLYCGYLGGAASDTGYAIAVDSTGNAYVAGRASSTEATFPVNLGPDLTHNGGADAFIAKLSPSGSSLLYAGYLGGAGDDTAYGIAIDAGGSAYVAGQTTSTQSTFPVTAGPDLTHNGGVDAFIAKLSPSGSSLLYAGYLGGAQTDVATAVAVDPSGYAYLAGWTQSSQSTFPVAIGPDLTHNGSADAFIAKLNPAGTALLYSGYVGGASGDYAYGIALDRAANAYLVGQTYSPETSFPVTAGPYLFFNGSLDAFVVKVASAGDRLVYAGYLGGNALDSAEAVAVDTHGQAYVAGWTQSTEESFPVLAGPNLTFSGALDAFLVKLSALSSTAGPLMAFRNAFNAIETTTFPSPALRNAGGNFRLSPTLALASSGRAFLIGRDSAVGVWLNILNPDETYSGWLFAGGNSPGQPALTATGDTAWIAVRDPWNSYSVRTYTLNSGFGAWTWLQGILATDPQIAACPNGDVYLTGRDNFNGVWTRRYSATTSSWQAWRFIGGIITGTPAIACGADNAAYIAARDPSNNMWLARVFEESSASWYYGAGIFQSDLQIAAQYNFIHVFGLAASVPWYRTWLIGAGWQGWTSPGGVLTHFAPAVYGANVFLAGQDPSGNLWWWSSLSNSWSHIGNTNVAPGSRFSAVPR